MSRFYVTTPIYYVNDVPHLGHAYTTIAADALARYHRLRGQETRFLTGTDEHGQKIETAAHARKMSERAFVDEVSKAFRALAVPLHCEPDDFIRTTDKRHIEVVQELWRRCEKNGDIYEGTYEGLYCVGCEAYYTEKELEQTPGGPCCPIHKTLVDRVKEPSFFFRLSKYEKPLLDWYARDPSPVQPESRRNEVISFVKGGLQDLSVSRTSFKWGIEVPDHPGHVVYVWFDALTNYLSALGNEGDPLRRFWPSTHHLIGKDILRFHTVYWPAFLMSAGVEPPKQVFAHGWLTINGQKMSKSLKNTVEPAKLAEVFGADVVRFYLLREVAFGQDGDFSHAQLVARYNAELADSLGNLLNRTLGLCAKLRHGARVLQGATTGALEERLAEVAETAKRGCIEGFDAIAPHRAVEAIWVLCRAANKYIDEAAPWTVAKRGAEAAADVDTILASSLEALYWIATMIWPVMPEVSAKMLAQLGRPSLEPKLESDRLAALEWEPRWEASKLQSGTPIFPKIDGERQAAIFAQLGVDATAVPADAKSTQKQGESKKREVAAPAAEITYDEFTRMDLRVGLVASAERVPKSDKLLKLMVDVGEGAPRQIVAGIGKSFAPETLVGRHVVVVANLKPAKLMGLESRGMVLAAAGEAGEADLALLSFTQPRVPGTRIK